MRESQGGATLCEGEWRIETFCTVACFREWNDMPCVRGLVLMQ